MVNAGEKVQEEEGAPAIRPSCGQHREGCCGGEDMGWRAAVDICWVIFVGWDLQHLSSPVCMGIPPSFESWQEAEHAFPLKEQEMSAAVFQAWLAYAPGWASLTFHSKLTHSGGKAAGTRESFL